AEHADGILGGLSPSDIRVARELLLRLVTAEGTRRVVSASKALDGLGPAAREVLTRLTHARLITVGKGRDERKGETVLELVHESLVRTWSRLARWIDESREELVFLADVNQAAELWDKRGRRDEELWQGDALHEARRTLARCTTRVPALVQLFLAEGQKKERRRQRRKRLLAATGVSLLAGVAVFSIIKERETRLQKEKAEAQRAEAQREGARAALGRDELLEARAKLRGSLETQDSPLARALWWKLKRDPLVWRKDFGAVAYSTAFSPDGRTIAVGCNDRLVHLVDTETLHETRLRGFDKESLGLSYSPDGTHLAAGTLAGDIGLWHLPTGALRALKGHTNAVWQLAFTPDGSHLFSVSLDKTIRRWNVLSSDDEVLFATLPSPHVGIAISHDGRLLATAGHDRAIRLRDVATGTEARVLHGHTDGVIAVAISPDGSTIASGSSDRTIRIWDTASGKQLALLRGHSDVVKGVAFADEGRLLVSASYDKSVRLWDVALRKEISVLTMHTDKIAGLSTSPRGHLAASASYDKTVRL
ncbi:MAG: WD40 repeat domain-containing protein, partial [Pseudomonadota bacterium]